MNIATVSFSIPDFYNDASGIDVIDLNRLVMSAFDRHFGDYERGAAALSDYRTVQATVRNDECLTLFDAAETMRACLDAHPSAGTWAAFEREATEAIKPFGFSMRFSGSDHQPKEERP